MAQDVGPTIETIEGQAWPEPGPDASTLVRRVHALRRTPLPDLSPDDLRVLLGQGVGLEAILPVALERVGEDPLVEGDFYPGDLLAALLGLGEEFWRAHPPWRDRLAALLADLDQDRPDFPTGTDLGARIDAFSGTR